MGEHLTWRKATLPIQRSAAIDRVLESGRLRILRRGATPIICIDFMWGQFLTEEFTVDNIIDANIWALEDILAEADAARTDGQPARYIAVSTGGPPTKELVKKISPVFDINYPERCATAIIYPIPRLMKFVADALLLLLPKRTREKFVLFSEEADFCAKTGLSSAELPEDLKGGIEAGKARRDQALKDAKRRDQLPKEFLDAMESSEGATQVLMSQVSC